MWKTENDALEYHHCPSDSLHNILKQLSHLLLTLIPGSHVIDVCKEKTTFLTEGYMKTPNYPAYYPIHRDCECNITARGRSRILVSFYDLLLEMDGKKCADWLMIYDDDYKDLNCGEIAMGMKNVSWQGPKIRMHFHSDFNDTRRQTFNYNTLRSLKGFWLYFKGLQVLIYNFSIISGWLFMHRIHEQKQKMYKL